jgi:hypothetical protein
LRTHDQNGDGRPDRWYTLRGGVVLEYRADNDFDGNVDALVKYGPGGIVTHEEYDFNGDGDMDDFYFYEKGMMVRREVDTNFDNRVDLWIYLVEGAYIARMERDTDFDGRVDLSKDYRQSAR